MKKKTKFISLSHWIDQSTPSYGNQGGFSRNSISEIKNGNTANSEEWSFNNHIGTHIDFPKHFYDDGQTSSDFKDPFFIFNKIEIIVLEKSVLPGKLIELEDLLPQLILLPKSTEVLLLKTNFEQFRDKSKYWNNNPGYNVELSVFFRSYFINLKVFGFDTISLTSVHHKSMGKKAHKAFLTKVNPILIIEDMSLSKLNSHSTIDELIIAEFPVKSSDGTPINCIAKVK
tara:strand:+ start:15 stop:701 length:687 start_codon:yes stop_codon:yes gene_type:complete